MSHQNLPSWTPAPEGPSDSTCSTSSSRSEGEIMDWDSESNSDSDSDVGIIINDDSTPELPNPSMEHFKQRYVLIHRLGAGDNGETYAANTKDHANRMLGLKRLGYPISLNTKDVVVVKFYKPNNLEGDLTNEITFMTESMRGTHSLLTHAIDPHYDALPYCNGGTLQSFIAKHEDAITTSFIWHVGLQLVQAACYLHFGIRDLNRMETVRDWPRVYHADTYTCNILLKADEDPSLFPDVVIADFGRARTWKQRTTNTPADEEYDALFAKDQFRDIRCIGRVMDTMRDSVEENKCTCVWPKCNDCQAQQAASSSYGVLNRWIDQLLKVKMQTELRMTSLLGFLKDFVQAGNAELLRTMQPLPLATSNFFYCRNLKCGSIFESLSNFEAHDPQAHQISRFSDNHELSLLTSDSQRNVILREIYREVTNTLPGRYILFVEKITKNMTQELNNAALLGLLCDEKARAAAMDKQLDLLLILKAYQTGGTCDVTSRAQGCVQGR
ncbi:hypothetical protein LTR78_000325 [Recurvomyces mirabilis]|uniref:Protein kinase domain-containing protein n=1 Tax=Recurvomyces mirabilis TaxID=574656 RepID=A0AAE0WXS3_9PEZI|nr:hypothetical protein LTR78_000325 [Recurvomyces mirabilis]KAK5161980.1 hypothetical protein LTS14_000326 [Recurvomyces mirabilis]